MVRNRLGRMFSYRHRVTAHDLPLHHAFTGKPMTIVVSGSNGVIGSALVPFLTTGGHRVIRLVRSTKPSREPTAYWDPSGGTIDTSALDGSDAVVHLAGEGVAEGRWTQEKKQRIRGSRVDGTRLLCEALQRLPHPPTVLVCASAVGYYGNRGDEPLTEDSPRGKGFLADVCEAWEAATKPAAEQGIRVVNLRIGVVLTPAGGALGTMLRPFKLGIGGTLGSGRQHMSWIAMDDLIGTIYHAIITDTLDGPVNAVAPSALTNADFTRILAQVLHRPSLLPVPAFVLRLLFGELTDEGLLASTRVTPRKLLQSGYVFQYPDLEGTLRHLLGRI